MRARQLLGNVANSIAQTVAALALAVMQINGCFGDGSDGDITTSGAVSLSRDMYYNNLTVNAGTVITTNGWRIYVKNNLDLTNAPSNAIRPITPGTGGNAAGTSAGAANTQLVTRSWQSSEVAVGGVGGGTTTGSNGTANAAVRAYTGGLSGNGGAGGSGSSGAGGNGGVATASGLVLNPQWLSQVLPWCNSSGPPIGGVNGPSGGAGGGDGTAGGGSGGAGNGGGMVFIAAFNIIRSSANVNAGVIACVGMAGGNGGSPAGGNRGGGGGAGGGGGGSVYVLYGTLSGSFHTNCIDVTGGNGGNGAAGTGTGTAGTGGAAGFGGRVILINANTGSIGGFNGTATGNNAAAGTVGGVATAARCNL